MFKHIVLYKLKDTSEAKTTQITRAFNALKGIVPQLIDLQCGKDVVQSPRSYDYALICTFNSQSDMEAYQVHPEHQKVKAFVSEQALSAISADFMV